MEAETVRDALARLAAIERSSASAGEAHAAELLAEMLRERGLEPLVERESAVGGFWHSTGLAAGAGALAALLGARRPRMAAALAAVAAALMADDSTTACICCDGRCRNVRRRTCSPGRATPGRVRRWCSWPTTTPPIPACCFIRG